jgi:orotidine-5'-phosphate decarboxylase
MNIDQLISTIKEKKSFLCVGLDTDISKIPKHLLNEPNPTLAFNKAIIDATKNYCVSYKINTAFYEAQGVLGWQTMKDTVGYIGSNHFIIADAKRGDIGNTCDQYAKAFFEKMNFDAITIAPYMGADSIKPFLKYENKTAIVLGLTSNDTAVDFEMLSLQNGKHLYETVLEKVSEYGKATTTMFVIGATKTEELQNIRKIIPNHFLLVPGVGFQGGSLAEVTKFGINENIGLLVNVSRAIIYASNDDKFASEAAAIAQQYQFEMAQYITPILTSN